MVTSLAPDDPRRLGDYQITGRLGEGGQGVVYLGYSASGEPVAVKVLKTGLDPVVRGRLSRELAAIRSVASFCTARVIDAVVEGREPYVVSEFIDGPSLQQRVAASGPLRGGELERLAVGTATALAAIHGAGIVHRDFKPANVLLGPDGPRVVDFGIARQGESDTITAGPIGTPAYLAPEQIAGQPAKPASDVFAWGATMVFAANGKAAFGADSIPSVMHRILTATPDVSAVPSPLREIVTRALDKDPARRPTSQDLLLTLVGSPGRPVGALNIPAVDTRPSGQGRGGRRAGVIAAAAAVVVALGVVAAIFVPRMLNPPAQTPTPTPEVTSQVTTEAITPTATETETTNETGAVIPAGFAGTWSGHIVPTPAGLTGEYDVRIELSAGKSSGKWFEPANSCEGTLNLTAASAAALTFDLVDAGECVPGKVTLTKRGSALTYKWEAPLLRYDGTLRKA